MIKKARVINNSWSGCFGIGEKRFPSFAIIVLVLGILWFLNGVGILTIDVPWFSVILIIISLGWIINHYRR